MAFDEALAVRVRAAIGRMPGVEERRMFGSACFLLDGNLLVGVWHDSLIARLGPEAAAEALGEPHVGKFDVTGRPMKGWVMVGPEGVEDDEQLRGWVGRAWEFVRALPAK